MHTMLQLDMLGAYAQITVKFKIGDARVTFVGKILHVAINNGMEALIVARATRTSPAAPDE